jgi:GxxExxY protein
LEKVYQQALKYELESRGFTAEDESEINVMYQGRKVGFYKADLFVNNSVIVELKTGKEYQSADAAQLLNELKCTGMKVGFLINFGRTKVEFKRFVF